MKAGREAANLQTAVGLMDQRGPTWRYPKAALRDGNLQWMDVWSMHVVRHCELVLNKASF
jgi:hypothetical protein